MIYLTNVTSIGGNLWLLDDASGSSQILGTRDTRSLLMIQRDVAMSRGDEKLLDSLDDLVDHLDNHVGRETAFAHLIA